MKTVLDAILNQKVPYRYSVEMHSLDGKEESAVLHITREFLENHKVNGIYGKKKLRILDLWTDKYITDVELRGVI